jgi:hypothetical protein
MGQAMKDAFDKSVAATTGLAHDHPVFCTLVALGILVTLAPLFIKALGFGELGPVGGYFQARLLHGGSRDTLATCQSAPSSHSFSGWPWFGNIERAYADRELTKYGCFMCG